MINLNRSYTGKMSIYEFEKIKGNSGYYLQKKLVYDNVPCLLTSMVTKRSIARDSTNPEMNKQSLSKKIFLSNQYIIKNGSYIEVYQDGRYYVFDYSGESFVYVTHQEIILETEVVA